FTLFHLFFVFLLMIWQPPISTLFPYTTLFRSLPEARPDRFAGDAGRDGECRCRHLWRRHPVRRRERCDVEQADFRHGRGARAVADRKSTRLNSSHVEISYAVFCLKKKKKNTNY